MADRGRLAWQAGPGRQTVQVTLDDAGARRHGGPKRVPSRRAAGRPHRRPRGRPAKIQAKTAAQVEIDGNFDAHQAERLLRGLLGPLGRGRRRYRFFAGERRGAASSADGRWLLLTALECGNGNATVSGASLGFIQIAIFRSSRGQPFDRIPCRASDANSFRPFVLRVRQASAGRRSVPA